MGRIADCDPADGDGSVRGKARTQMDDGIDADFGAERNVGSMEDGDARGDEDAIFQRAAGEMSVRADQAMGADGQGVMGCGADYSVFHDDTVSAEAQGRSFRVYASAEHDAAARGDLDIAADGGIACDVS